MMPAHWRPARRHCWLGSLLLAWLLVGCNAPTPPTATPAVPTVTPTRTDHIFRPLCGAPPLEGTLHVGACTYTAVVRIDTVLSTVIARPPSPPPFALEPSGLTITELWQTLPQRFPLGTPLLQVRGIPTSEMFAIQYKDYTQLYCFQPNSVVRTSTVVIDGRVSHTIPNPYCQQASCAEAGDLHDKRQSAIVAVSTVWAGHGIQPDQEVIVSAMAGASDTTPFIEVCPLPPGQTVILLLRPVETMEDYTGRKGQAPVIFVWVAQPQHVYYLEDQQVRWGCDPKVSIPLAQFRADIAATFGPPP